MVRILYYAVALAILFGIGVLIGRQLWAMVW